MTVGLLRLVLVPVEEEKETEIFLSLPREDTVRRLSASQEESLVKN